MGLPAFALRRVALFRLEWHKCPRKTANAACGDYLGDLTLIVRQGIDTVIDVAKILALELPIRCRLHKHSATEQLCGQRRKGCLDTFMRDLLCGDNGNGNFRVSHK